MLAGDTAELRKARGAYFTPREICRFVVDWAVRDGSEDVLEPACGEAAFLTAAVHRLDALHVTDGGRLAGVELHEASAAHAARLVRQAGRTADVRETLGEATNLRDRYPLAAMGYAFVVSQGIFAEKGAYARLQDLLLRTRKPDGPYDATMLLIADWDAGGSSLHLTDPRTNTEVGQQQPPVELDARRFFGDLLGAVIANTPVGIHQTVREHRNGATPGGAPDPAADAEEVAASEGKG